MNFSSTGKRKPALRSLESVIALIMEKTGKRLKNGWKEGIPIRQVLMVVMLSVALGVFIGFAAKGSPASGGLPLIKLNIQKFNWGSLFHKRAARQEDFRLDNLPLFPLVESSKKAGREKMFDYGFAKRRALWTHLDPETQSKVVRVPFIVKNEGSTLCRLCPVEGGIPFPAGELKSLRRIRVRNAAGEDVPFQPRVLVRWPDGSIKWLSMHFESTLASGDGAGYLVEYGPKVKTIPFSEKLHVEEDSETFRVYTGVMQAVLSKRSFYLFEKVFLDQNGNSTFEPQEQVAGPVPLVLTSQGKEFRTDLDPSTYQVEVEENGTQKAVIKASGWFRSVEGQRFCQVIVRFYFYSGKSYVKVSHTLVYTGYPENKVFEDYRHLKLPPNEMIESFGIRIPYSFSSDRNEQLSLGRAQAEPLTLTSVGQLDAFQRDYTAALIKQDGTLFSFGDSYAGWFDLSTKQGGVAVAVRHFRENFPKAFKFDRAKNEIDVDLWPHEAGPLDLSTTEKARGPESRGKGSAFGLAKTHDLLIYFHTGNASQSKAFDISASFMKPLVIRTNPYWIDATGALGRLYPSDKKYATEEAMLSKLFEWAERHPRDFQWYGMLNFGDTLTWWRDGDDDQGYDSMNWNPVGRWGWYNCEGVGTHTGALLQYARSGEWRYFEFGENLARHIMDVDTIHYDTIANDRRLNKILNEKFSQVGSMHRHNGDHWGGESDEASHTSVVGILLYYYLTGNERAWDVAKEVGEYFLTEPFTYAGHPDVAPHRAMANALWGDVLMYEATGDGRYKEAADKIVKVYLKGQQPDGSFLENYNPIQHTWSGEKHEMYMGWYLIGALVSYHELTQDKHVGEMLLKLVRYLAPTEYTGPSILHGMAYAYLITHDSFYSEKAEEHLKNILTNQQTASDPLQDGLIYGKPIYHRPNVFLSTVPYAFGALEEKFSESQK